MTIPYIVFMIEEAIKFARPGSSHIGDAGLFATRSRFHKLSSLYILQSPSLLDGSIASNTKLKLICGCQGEEVGATARICNLDRERIEIVSKLSRGTISVVLHGDRCPPLLGKVVPLPFEYRPLTSEEREALVRRSMDVILQDVIPRRPRQPEASGSAGAVSADEERLLVSILQGPGLPTMERADDLNWPYKRMARARDGLMHRGLIQTVVFKPGGRKQVLLTEVSTKGIEWARQHGHEVRRKGRGGEVHAFLCRLVKRWLEAGGAA